MFRAFPIGGHAVTQSQLPRDEKSVTSTTTNFQFVCDKIIAMGLLGSPLFVYS
jgi:hypothetical protein